MSFRNMVLEHFQKNPNRYIDYDEIRREVSPIYKERYGREYKDMTVVRNLCNHEGLLIRKPKTKGVFKLNPNPKIKSNFEFSQNDKTQILKRDNYVCSWCGKGINDGIKLVVDHIKPIAQGGTNSIENGQVLCEQHNLIKKGQSEIRSLKDLFQKRFKSAVKVNDQEMINFYTDILKVYKESNILEIIKNRELR